MLIIYSPATTVSVAHCLYTHNNKYVVSREYYGTLGIPCSVQATARKAVKE